MFLFDVKKEPKNRHRFDAVDADQGCGFLPGRLCRPMARSAMQKTTRSVGSEIGRPRTAAIGWVRNLAYIQLPGRRYLAVGPFLFDAKKEAKKRHRFDAVDADQGCGPGPGVCGHLTTAYSPAWGPVSKEWI